MSPLLTRFVCVYGAEMQVGTNHLGHFHLVTSLMDVLVASKPARVVIVSSLAHENSPNPKAYLTSDNLESPYVPWGTCESRLPRAAFALILALGPCRAGQN